MYATKLFRYGTICCALILAGTAQADQLITSQEFAVDLTTDQANSPVSEEVFVAGFDPALGTLTGISVHIDGALDGRWGVENLAEKERVLLFGGGARVSVSAGKNRELLSVSANEFTQKFLPQFDGTDDCRGASAASGHLSADESETIKLDPSPGWVKTKDPQGVPLTLAMIGRVYHDADMSRCIRLDAKVSIRVDYHYDDGSKSLRLEKDSIPADAPEPIHARREDAIRW